MTAASEAQGGDFMAEFDSKYVVCPFYRGSDSNRIRCEGLTEKNTINLVFEDSNKQKDYKKEYCCDIDNYQNCMICCMLERKYGD